MLLPAPRERGFAHWCTMRHYTLNTGHTRTSPRSEVGDDVIRHLQPLLEHGVHAIPGIEGYTLSVTIDDRACLATVYAKGSRPCVSIGVAVDDDTADQLWRHLETWYHTITELPGIRSANFAVAKRPESTPWCAAITVAATPTEAHWIADLERCVAWAWIERMTP